MSSADTSKANRDRFGMTPEDRQRRDAMSDEEIIARALTDPDNPPLTDEQLARVRRPAYAKRIRHKLRMGRETFCKTYGIPLETLKAWERHAAEPTPVEEAYLRLIEREPEISRVVDETAPA